MNKQERVQKQFKDFILNDIFWFDKSELNFGIYKIFRQKEKLIRESIDRIVSNIEGSLSSTPDNALEALKKKLIDNYIPGIKAKELPLDTLDDIKRAIREYGNGHKEMLLEELGRLGTNEEHNTTKVYEYLYQFFNLYYEKGDFGYTPRSFRTYTVPYSHEDYFMKKEDKCSNETSVATGYNGEETLFTWKTFDSYYIKSNKFLNSVSLTLTYQGEEYVINTSIVDKDEDIRDDKKIKQYRLVSVEKNGQSVNLKFNISDHPTPKHTIYLLLLSVIHENVSFLDYNGMFQDPKTKDYFEKLPFNDTKLTTSLFDDAQSKILAKFKQFIQDEDFARYVLEFKRDREGNIKSVADIFKSEIKGEEDKTQLKSKVSKLLIKKKDYAKKLYSAKAAKSFLGVNKLDLDKHKDVERLFEKDPELSFFYRLDRGINMFYVGVDSDYFIHKNLKRFLSVELDKFIKNYIFADTNAILSMDESAKRIATFARVFKEQAEVFIDLLSSIEEFQKYLWEKRKMVKRSHYIISSNKVKNTELLKKVLGNRDQIDEWEELGITEKNIKPKLADLNKHSYPIDTKHFDTRFKYEILSQFEDIEEETSGLLVKSENFQALRFLEPKYTDKTGEGRVKSIYIDPPYNTGNDGFVYKDNFKSASWLSMMQDRLEVAKRMMGEDGVIFTSIDENEVNNLRILNKRIFGQENFISNITILANKGGQDYLKLSKVHENLLVYSKTIKAKLFDLQKENVKLNFEDDFGKYQLRELRNRNPKYNKENRPNLYFPIYVNQNKKDKYGFCDISLNKDKDYCIEVYPLNKKGESSVWRWSKEKILKEKNHVSAKQKKDGKWNINEKYRKITEKAKSVWDESSVSTESGTKAVRNLFDKDLFSHPKPPKLIEKVANLTLDNQILLDYFAGSGTSFHSIININSLTNLYNDIKETIVLLEEEKEKKLTENKFLKLLDRVNILLDNIINLSFNYNSIDNIVDIISNCINEDAKGNKKVNVGVVLKDTIEVILELLHNFVGEFELYSFNDYKMNKYIGIELGEYFDNTTIDRIKKLLFSTIWTEGKYTCKYGYSTIVQYIELEQYDDIIDNLEVVDGVDYSQIDFGYIYEPDKNQIIFRMESELKNPLSEDARFDIFSSLLFHEGLELKKVEIKDDVLFAVCTDKSEKSCAIVLSVNEEKAKEKIKSIESDFYSVYTNVLTHNSIHIAAEMFKGR